MSGRNDGRDSRSARLKRNVVLVLIALAGLVALEQTGMMRSVVAFGQTQDGPSRGRQVVRQVVDVDEEVAGKRQTSRNDCGYLQEPDAFREATERHRQMVSGTTMTLAAAMADNEIALASPQDIPRRNFIDNILFDRMALDNVMSAPLCTDEQFVRRVYLDLTGRIPTATTVTNFLADSNPNKRAALIDALVGTPEYVDKWTMFFGDLFKVSARATNVTRYNEGRDAFYNYLRSSITANKSYAQMATEMITAGIPVEADNFIKGEANFIVGGIIPMGPRTGQDTMDGTSVNVASMFLGLQSLDCLYCHNGEGHLNSVNLWGAQRTRFEAWEMAAFFARTRRQREVVSTTPNYAKYRVSENAAGEYQLNTESGNRTPRRPTNGVSVVAPDYILGGGGLNAGETRRQALARYITADRQFARAAVNYVWEKLMVEALVSPSNAFDPARLDPNAQLPAGWSLQPANPQLLEALTDEFIKSKYDLRNLIATITKSSAYQLSAEYPGSWSLALLPYYARKYVRRLDAEEIHDAILRATSIGVTYQMRDTPRNNTFTVNWAMQLPDISEPVTNNNSRLFLDSFIRGDRDVKPRSIEPSIQQALNLMNNSFVMTRIHQNNNGSTVQRLVNDTSLNAQQIITQLYLSTLSRNPSQAELNTLTPLFTSLSRRDATEAIQWALLNKMDFVFNY